MEFNKELTIRTSLILIGIIIILFGVYQYITQILPIYTQLQLGIFSFNNINLNILTPLIFIILGYVIYLVGRGWKNFFKLSTKIFISFAVFFITLAIILHGINSNAEKISSNIQPTIDYLIVNSIDDMILNQLPISNGKTIQLSLSQDFKIKTLYVKNLTLQDTTYFENILSENFGTNLNNQQKIDLTKILISQIYLTISSTNKDLLNVGIPLSEIEKYSSQSNLDNVDLNTLDLTDEQKLLIDTLGQDYIKTYLKENVDFLISNFEINQDAYLKLLLSNNSVEKQIIIGQINNQDLNLIWNNLKLNPQISYETKSIITNLLLSQLLIYMPSNQQSIAIPLASISDSIPENIKQITNYDLFNKETSIKINELNKIRNDCKTQKLNFSQICDNIQLTDYTYFINNLEENLAKFNLELDNTTISTLKEFNSNENISNKIKEKTNKQTLFFILFFLFIGLAYLSYYTHFKFNKEEKLPFQIEYYLSKQNLLFFIPTFIFLSIFYYLIIGDVIFNFIKDNLDATYSNSLNLVLKSPLFENIISIINSIFTNYVIYLIISILLWAGFYYLLKKEVEKATEKENLN